MITARCPARNRRIAGCGRAADACQIVATIGPCAGEAPMKSCAGMRQCDVGIARHPVSRALWRPLRHPAKAPSRARATRRDFEMVFFTGNVGMRRLLVAVGLTAAMAGGAQGEIFKIPEEKAAISIDVPDGWSPNLSDDTIDMTSPDRAIFFWLTVEKEADAAAVKAEALKAIIRNGMKIDQATVKEAASPFAGLDSTEWVYSATDNGQPRLVKIRATRLADNRFI